MKNRSGGCLLIIAVIVVLAAMGAGYSIWNYEFGTEHYVTLKVSSLDDQSGGSSHKYLVFATDPGGHQAIYENTDAFLHGKNNSSDVQAWLSQHLHQELRCDVYGWRNHFISSYQDILHCDLLRNSAVHS